jgi:transposase-like protein
VQGQHESGSARAVPFLFIRKWRLKHRAVVDSLEEAGDRLFTFTRLPPSQWRSVRTTNAIERLHEVQASD